MAAQSHDCDTAFSTQDRKILTLLLAILFGLLPFFPQLSHPEFAFVFRTFICILLGLALYRLGISQIISRLKWNPLFLPLTAALLMVLIGCFYTPDFFRAKAKFTVYLIVFFLYCFVQTLPWSHQDRRRMAAGLVLGAIAAALQALYIQLRGHEAAIETLKNASIYAEEMQREIMRSLEANRATGQFGNPNHLAGYLILSLWPLWWLWKNAEGVKKWLWVIGGAVLSFAAYQTFSRSGLLVLGLFLLMAWIYPRILKGRLPSLKTTLIVTSLLLAIGLLGVFFLKDKIFGGRLLTLSTMEARMHFYRGGALIVREYPLFGVGTEGYEPYYCGVIRPGDFESHYVHNLILEAGCELGFVGVFLLFWLIAALMRWLRVLWNRKETDPALLYAAGGAAAGLFFLSMLDFHNNLIEMLIAPILLTALIAPQTPDSSPRVPVGKRTGQFAGVCLFFAWFSLIACSFGNSFSREAAYYLSLDEQIVQARAFYERAVWFDWTDADSWRGAGRLWAGIPALRARERGLNDLEQAVRWAPMRASIRSDYADALFAAGYIDHAIEEMRAAQRLFPARPDYHEKLAVFFRTLGSTKEAEREEQIAQELKTEFEERRSP